MHGDHVPSHLATCDRRALGRVHLFTRGARNISALGWFAHQSASHDGRQSAHLWTTLFADPADAVNGG